jgi:ribosomal-protein-alanine N-acetyltransferase
MPPLLTSSLTLLPHTAEHLRALCEGAASYTRCSGRPLADGLADFTAAASPEWLARLQSATGEDPWTWGFALVLTTEDRVIGMCGFKGPPAAGGTVEIAYGIAPGYQGRGYATEAAEAAQALVAYAIESGRVRIVRAHTLPQPNASTRVLQKCGFTCIGEVLDPEDGLVWRWELNPEK